MSNECIPECFKRGVQIPLYKGKDACVLDVNSYRRITLLPTYNKLFEILIWHRLKTWWYDENVISELQGACREGSSCVHTAFNLRETLAASMEGTGKCFVAFFDVIKAFDTVWIDGLFKQMYDLGITGAILILSVVSRCKTLFLNGMNPDVEYIKGDLCR